MGETGIATGSATEADARRVPGPQLVEQLYTVLYHDGLDRGRIAESLRGMEREHGAVVYSEMLFLLSHLRFDGEEARAHWQRILEHQAALGDPGGAVVDLRVAMLSYFLEVNRQLHSPKIIELRLFEETREQAYRDELTGLYNYRFFRECLGREIERAARDDAPLSLLMLDIDHFKAYNDRRGHDAGNEVLRTFARLLDAETRPFDVAARFGGEEFVLILPATRKTEARDLAERVRLRVASHPFRHALEQPGGSVTASIGVATCPADATVTDELIRAADRAMYLAKNDGRNRVRLHGLDRRSHRRVDVALCGTLRPTVKEPRPLTTRNVSEAGLLIETDRPLERGALVDIALAGPRADRPIAISARVVSVAPSRHGSYELALRTVEISPEDRQALRDHLQGD